jgi:hypothetical protein
MMTLRLLCFASAFACAAANAQDCSGGASGGVDATGNQCSTPGAAAAAATLVARPAAAVAAPAQARTAPAGIRSVGVPNPAASIAAARPTADRFTSSASSPAAPVHTAKIDPGKDPSCSGGADGGVDATGNQCTHADTPLAFVAARMPAR